MSHPYRTLLNSLQALAEELRVLGVEGDVRVMVQNPGAISELSPGRALQTYSSAGTVTVELEPKPQWEVRMSLAMGMYGEKPTVMRDKLVSTHHTREEALATLTALKERL